MATSREDNSDMKSRVMSELFPPKPDALVSKIDDLLKGRPLVAELASGELNAITWLGEARSAIEAWDTVQSARLVTIDSELWGPYPLPAQAYSAVLTLLAQARASIRLRADAPSSVSVGSGMVFDYFEGIRGIIERATNELFFVDPYLDPEFVARYLALAHRDVKIRLLTRKGVERLMPAVEAYSAQSSLFIEVRSIAGIHDRYIFLDGGECHQSGASFKDGAKIAPTAVSQIIDAFDAMLQTYEAKWTAAKVHR